MRQLTKNFNLIEFQSKDGSIMPEWVEKNVIETAKNLQILRNFLGYPIHISSAYRSKKHNERIGGVINSRHLDGTAVDISCKNISSKKLYKKIEYLISIGHIKEGGLGVYNGFVHYDTRGYKARWNKIKWFS